MMETSADEWHGLHANRHQDQNDVRVGQDRQKLLDKVGGYLFGSGVAGFQS